MFSIGQYWTSFNEFCFDLQASLIELFEYIYIYISIVMEKKHPCIERRMIVISFLFYPMDHLQKLGFFNKLQSVLELGRWIPGKMPKNKYPSSISVSLYNKGKHDLLRQIWWIRLTRVSNDFILSFFTTAFEAIGNPQVTMHSMLRMHGPCIYLNILS